MNDFQFKNVVTKQGHSYAFKVFSVKEGKQHFPTSDFKKELTQFQSEEEKAYELESGMALLVAEYSYTLYPSVKDLTSFKQAIASTKEEPYSYQKILDPQDPRERILLKPNADQITYLQYSQKTGGALLASLGSVQEEKPTQSTTILRGDDGRIVHYHDREKPACLLFNTQADYDFYHTWFYTWFGHSRVWCGRNPYQQDVLQHKEALLRELAEFLQIDRSAINFEPGSHHRLHRAIRELIFDDYTVNKLFLPLTIYLGAFQLKLWGGQWGVIFDEAISTWKPVLMLNEKPYDIGQEVYYRLLDPNSEKFPSLGEAWKKLK